MARDLKGMTATALALGFCLCGDATAQCGDPPAGAPANDCATSATMAEPGYEFTFSNVDASTDGPNGVSGTCAVNIGNDLWWMVQSPGTGYLTATLCNGTDFDTVIEVFALGQTSEFDPELLPEYQIGCADDTCGVTGGPSIITLFDTKAGDYFLFRIGGRIDDATGILSTGNGTVLFEFLNVIYNTGAQRPFLNNGTLTNLALSSGYLNATFPQRWIAAPFTVPAPPNSDSWLVQTIAANGFTPFGSVNETMEWIIWARDAATNAAPVDGDQVVSGSVPFPAPIDDPTGNPANEQHDIATDFVLAAGDYYLTVYAANSTGGASAANFAWFCNAPDGIDLVDAQGPFCWRSAFQPAPGFQRYTLPAGFQQQEGLDPNDLYAVGFKILGTPVEDCDFNGILDVDDLDAGAADCNGNNILDACEFEAIAFRSPFGAWTPLSHLFTGLNPSFEEISITIEFLGDFDSPTEFASLRLDGQSFGAFGVLDGPGCDDAPLSVEVTIPAATYNTLAADGQLEVVLEASSTASPSECENAFARVVLPIHLVATDCDGSGQPDACEIAAGFLEDCDANGIPDICDASAPDCNANGRPDTCDIAEGTLADCDGNGILDLCDASAPDCNANGRPDACDIAEGTLEDCDTNGIPDLCQLLRSPGLDCDEDERLDGCQIAESPGLDKNSDGVLDSCSLAFGDFNLDGVVDNTDLAVLLSIWGQANSPIGDLNGDGIVDGEDLGILLIHWGPAF